MKKKQWFPIKLKTSSHYTWGRWFVQNYDENGKPKPLLQIIAFGYNRIILGK